MKKTIAIVSVGIRQMLADPVYIMFLIGLPIMMTWVMSFLPVEGGMYEMAALGVLVMFVALNIITSAGGYILEEKQNGTWHRILASSTSYWNIMAGYFIKLFMMAIMQSAVLLLSSKYLFGAPWNQGYLEMVVVLIVYIFTMTGLGLFLAGFLKSQGQIQAVAMAVVMIGTMLGGVFFPIDNSNTIIRVIASISPQSWAANTLKEILTVGVSLSSLLTPLLWMSVIGLLLLIGGVIKLQMEG
ncbi:ABC transporter permease [Candidatus Contubernalis alkaliaceticus]|uniref:ABC transporter permease n=1 Tax=Candidatus Contubernalis alkaliaceticus TaxID=338645 RepID=UPI001F4BFFAD|nr:ABC transporter permease [Candidatus Contubernalis alkalaceticus]UNC92220.1 ABC transporter permease [Candidatus Contubernalis alkalaceticus]